MRPSFLKALVLVLSLFAVTQPGWADAQVNLYSSRQENLIKPLLEAFTQQTGIRVNLVTAKDDAIIKRLEAEGANSPADVLLTADAGRLHRAQQLGLLQPIQSQALETAVPAAYRDPAGHWFGLSLRARPILYVKGRVDAADLSTYEALADPKWQRRICIRSSDNIYNQSLVAAMIATQGVDKTEAWGRGLVANFARKPTGGDRDQIKAAAAGQCDIAIANTYYLAGMLHADDPAEREAAGKLAIFWPNQEGRGTHVNVSGAGVTTAAKNKDNAVRLLEFLVSDEAQRWYAEVNHEYPVKPGVAWSDTLKAWGAFKADGVSVAKLGEHNAEAVRLMDRVGWK